MHLITGDIGDNKIFDAGTLENWGTSLITRIDSLQDSNKYFREHQVGWDKKHGQSGISELEARVPHRLMHAYMKTHPDFDYQDDRQWYHFLNAHPEIDTRKRREAHVNH